MTELEQDEIMAVCEYFRHKLTCIENASKRWNIELRRKDAIIAELVEASKTSMHIHTSELPDEWMRSQAYEEAPYHFLWAAIAHATAKPEEKRD